MTAWYTGEVVYKAEKKQSINGARKPFEATLLFFISQTHGSRLGREDSVLPPKALPQPCILRSGAKLCLPTRHGYNGRLSYAPNSVRSNSPASTLEGGDTARGCRSVCKANVNASEQCSLRPVVSSRYVVGGFSSEIRKPVPTLHRPAQHARRNGCNPK